MRNHLKSIFLLVQSAILVVVSSSSSGPHASYTIHTTLRGKKYTLTNVSTVKEVQQSLLEKSSGGASASTEDSNIILLFGGQKLKSNDVLEDIGVEDGSIMNAIPSSTTSKKKKKKQSSAASSNANDSSSSSSSSGAGGMPNMEELMKQSGLDPNLINNLLSQSGAGGGGEAPDLEQSMKMMQEMISTPYFQEFLNDPSKMEESRQLLLQNPMMKTMIESIPFMKDIIGDKDAFRQTMLSAAQMYKDMGSDGGGGMADAMQKMSGMFGGMPGLDMNMNSMNMNMNGMFDNTNIDNNLALDELSEGDDDE